MVNNGTLDLAGGLVVHITAAISALILAKMLGPRLDFPDKLHPPHHPVLVMVGACMLWVGWFGFNAGSQLAANQAAGMTMLVTHISASVASLTWMCIEWAKNRKPSLVGIVTGMVAGLASITPASGSVGPVGAIIIGLLAGLICYFMCGVVKTKMGIDDSLDVFAVHGVGGAIGTISLAIFGDITFGGLGIDNIGEQLLIQIKGVGAVIIWSAVGTYIIVKICQTITGLRVSDEDINHGLDKAEHGETSYNFN